MISKTHDVTIASGGATSGASQDLRGLTLVAVRTPSTFDGTTLQFTCCETVDGTYLPIHNADGTAYELTLAASRHTTVDLAKFVGVRFLKLVAGSNQTTTDTIVTLVVRPVA